MSQEPIIPRIIGGQLLKSDAVNFLAERVYPGDDPRFARKRARDLVRYGIKTGLLSPAREPDGDYLNAAEFFDWAKGKWPELRRFSGLPTVPAVLNIQSSIHRVFSAELQLRRIPSDPQELRAQCEAAIQALVETESDLTQCQEELARMTAEVNEWREKDRITRQRASDAGKRGKGVKRRRS